MFLSLALTKKISATVIEGAAKDVSPSESPIDMPCRNGTMYMKVGLAWVKMRCELADGILQCFNDAIGERKAVALFPVGIPPDVRTHIGVHHDKKSKGALSGVLRRRRSSEPAPTVYGIVAQVRTEGGFEEYHFAATSSRDQRKWRDALEGCNYERRLSIDSFGSTTSEGTDGGNQAESSSRDDTSRSKSEPSGGTAADQSVATESSKSTSRAKNIAFDSSDEEESFDERAPLVSRSGEELYKLAFEGEMYKTDPSQTSWLQRYFVLDPFKKTLTYYVDSTKREKRGVIKLVETKKDADSETGFTTTFASVERYFPDPSDYPSLPKAAASFLVARARKLTSVIRRRARTGDKPATVPPKPYAFVVHVSSGRSLFFCVDKEEDARTWTQKMKELVGEEYKPYEYDDTEANARQKYASRPANMLVVTLLRGRGLPAMDSNGKSDPFAELCVQPPKSIIPGRRLAREKPKIKRSKTKKKTLKPNWGQNLSLK